MSLLADRILFEFSQFEQKRIQVNLHITIVWPQT